MPDRLYDWGEEFDALERAQTEVLFLLASSLRASWPDLYAATRYFNGTWVRYVEHIAKIFSEQVASISARANVINLWSQFENVLDVQQSPAEVRSIFARVRLEIETRLRDGGDPLLYLAQCNVRACEAVEDLLKGFGIDDPAVRAVPVLLIRDEHGKQPLASTFPGKAEIRWAIQAKPRALWAALAAQSILEHEYLSHLAPRSPSLSPYVREEWLMAVLLLDIHRRSDADNNLLWYLRQRLGEWGELKLWRLQDAASVMSSHESSSRVYVSFNRELLTMPIGPDTAARVDRILEALNTARPEAWRRLLGGSWDGSIAGFPGFP
ncbi:MAG TPA: hypothetical protein VHC97_25360 [Thermoanaerobaculia bacterium]|nr:hypothetical protein [Thermoanaerobaculia bacterium]